MSLWIEQGFSIKEIMTFAGHSSIQMTMERYGHLFPSVEEALADALDAAFTANEPEAAKLAVLRPGLRKA